MPAETGRCAKKKVRNKIHTHIPTIVGSEPTWPGADNSRGSIGLGFSCGFIGVPLMESFGFHDGNIHDFLETRRFDARQVLPIFLWYIGYPLTLLICWLNFFLAFSVRIPVPVSTALGIIVVVENYWMVKVLRDWRNNWISLKIALMSEMAVSKDFDWVMWCSWIVPVLNWLKSGAHNVEGLLER